MNTLVRPKAVISLFDYTGEAVKPWAEAGYLCFCFDIQHPAGGTLEGNIWYLPWDADEGIAAVIAATAGLDVEMVFSFTPCTDLAGSGARHFKAKAEKDPEFQAKAVAWARLAETLAGTLKCRYMVENPRGMLSTLWRKPNFYFDPCDYGGYIPEDQAAHPKWPEIIPERDAYTKFTGIWASDDFVQPEKDRVEPIMVELTRKDGSKTKSSPMWAKLGGKSLKTKNIRSATPRGFAIAVFQANAEVARV